MNEDQDPDEQLAALQRKVDELADRPLPKAGTGLLAGGGAGGFMLVTMGIILGMIFLCSKLGSIALP